MLMRSSFPHRQPATHNFGLKAVAAGKHVLHRKTDGDHDRCSTVASSRRSAGHQLADPDALQKNTSSELINVQ